MKRYRAEHTDYYRKKHAEFRGRNREKLRISSRAYYDPEKAHAYYVANKDRIAARVQTYHRSDKGRAVEALHRARRRSGISHGDKSISLQAVFDRDGGRCRLCGGLCDYNDYIVQNGRVIVGKNYPSIDHITPLSRGGTHTWDNVQLAHMHCNTVKSNKLL